MECCHFLLLKGSNFEATEATCILSLGTISGLGRYLVFVVTYLKNLASKYKLCEIGEAPLSIGNQDMPEYLSE
jgi:hypothetical protein